jgi:hypothetical protein
VSIRTRQRINNRIAILFKLTFNTRTHPSSLVVGEDVHIIHCFIRQQTAKLIGCCSKLSAVEVSVVASAQIHTTRISCSDRRLSSAPSRITRIVARRRPDARRQTRVDRHLKSGHFWVVDADLQSYLDSSSQYTSSCFSGIEQIGKSLRYLNS